MSRLVSLFPLCAWFLVLVGSSLALLTQAGSPPVWATTAPEQADLLITSVTRQTGAASPTTAFVTVVKNQGKTAASGFHVYLYLDPVAAPPTHTTPAAGQLFFGAPLLAQDTFTWTHSPVSLTHPLAQLYAWVDPPWEAQVAEADETNNLFAPPQPAITQITPNHAPPGATLSVTIAATNIHFVQGVTAVDWGEAISVTQTTVLSPTVTVVQVQVAADAAPTTHTVTVTTGSEQIVAPDVFRVDMISDTATLHGIIDLPGRPAKPHAAWAISLTVELQPASGASPHIELLSSDAHGRFTWPDVTPGVYSLRVKGNHTLANRIDRAELQPGSNEIYLGTLMEGDVETNRTRNQVVVADFSQLSGAFDTCVGDNAYLHNADLNEIDNCVTIEDAALLIMYFNTQGDLRFPSPDRVPAPIPLRASHATLAFTTTRLVAPISQTVTLPLYVDPHGGDDVIGVTGHYTFNPTLLEVTALTLTEKLPQTLLSPTIDNQHGVVRFSQAAQSRQPISQTQLIATLQVRLKASTTGALLQPVLGDPRTTNLAGPNGSVLASATGIMLVSIAEEQVLPERVYLPVTVR